MKRLSISLPAITLVLTLALSGAAFTTAPATTASNTSINAKPRYTDLHVPFVREKFEYMYYWFWSSDDSYNDYESLEMEIWEMGEYYYPGYIIDNNPMGGTEIMAGYLNPNQPHISYPSTRLYYH